MAVSHHIDDVTILAHATGTLGNALSVVVEAHLEFCADCRASLKSAREIGGSLMRDQDAEPVDAALKDKVLGMIGSATVHRLPTPMRPRKGDVPLALRGFLNVEHFEDIQWNKSAPGLKTHKFNHFERDGGYFGLLHISPGARIPQHSHGGSELTLVLKGAYEDELGRFGRGDVADHDESVEHTPIVVGDEACICLVATESTIRFRSWPARLVQRFIGI